MSSGQPLNQVPFSSGVTRGGSTDVIPPWWADRARPVWTAAGLVAVAAALTVLIGFLSVLLLPGTGEDAVLQRRLAAVVVVAILALITLTRAGAWQRTGAAGPMTWRHTSVLIVPLLIALAPLVTGLDVPDADLMATLVAGYVATGVFEELWHRGVVLDSLRAVGLRRSAVIGGAFFAASHLANIAFGQAVMVSLTQAVGAFCFGIGFSIFRWRTNAVWLLVGIHATGDLMFKITNLHGGTLWLFLVGHDILMLLWGLWCLRGLTDDISVPAAPSDSGSGVPTHNSSTARGRNPGKTLPGQVSR